MVGRWQKASSSWVRINRTVEFNDLVRSRKMTRAFRSDSVDPKIVKECVELASRSPSAGKTQGWSLIVWEGPDVEQYWNIALPENQRSSFGFPHLLSAPLIMLSVVDTQAYLDRYSEQDKSRTGWGTSLDKWPAPFWTIDASFATMTLLLSLHDRGVGTLFFAHAHEDELRQRFNIPAHIDILGVIAAGYPDAQHQSTGRSAQRIRKSADEIIRPGSWS